jgi:hypothetical protein
VCVGFCSLEVELSPKAHEKAGVPEQLEGVAVAIKDAANVEHETWVAVAEQVRVQGDIVMVPLLVQT